MPEKSTTVTKNQRPKVKVDGRGQFDRKPVSQKAANKRIGVQPAKVKRERLEGLIDQFLVDQHCSLYGRSFYVTTSKDRESAVAFFSDFFEEINGRLG